MNPFVTPVLDPPIARHALVGDQRTGVLVAADGTLNWWCLPDFDGPPIFGTLLDAESGGYCRLGPAVAALGEQSYLPATTTAITRWTLPGDSGEVEVADLMAWPDDDPRPDTTRDQRVILRRVRAVGGAARVQFALVPRWNFTESPGQVERTPGDGVTFTFKAGSLGLWTSFPVTATATGALADWTLAAGEEHWVMLGWNAFPAEWTVARAAQVFDAATTYWRRWTAGLNLDCVGDRAEGARRAALTAQLLTHATYGTAVAALTTSLPERLGGNRNYDYRFAWVRDSSLALSLLARLGKIGDVRCYFHWLAGLGSSTDAPLQVVYGIDGRTDIEEVLHRDFRGYAGSLPVRVGNRAAKQHQLGSLAFLADCVRIYLEEDGKLEPKHWGLIERAARYTAKCWRQKGSGIWELEQQAHYVASRVMAWVVLERAGHIAAHTGYGDVQDLAHWRAEAALIHAEVMERGWSEEKQSFRQRYDSEALDAATLLIPLMRFLPPDHPRVLGTLAALERELVVGGLMHRFNPTDTLGGEQLPVGEFEGAFLPCVFWHAHAYALVGRLAEARAIMDRVETLAGPVGLLAEEMGCRQNIFLGNTPLLFSHAEYVRTAVAIHAAERQAASR